MTTVSTPHSVKPVNQPMEIGREGSGSCVLAEVRDLPLRQPCVRSPQRQWRLRSGASLATMRSILDFDLLRFISNPSC